MIVRNMIVTIVFVCFLVIGAISPCVAATVFLRNSDRITGEIQKLEGKHLSLKTAYAGVIEIDWSMVEGISSDQVLQFSMQNGMVLTGTVQNAEEGMQLSVAPGAGFCRTISRESPDQSTSKASEIVSAVRLS